MLKSNRTNMGKGVGVTLIIFSFIVWMFILAAPFLEISIKLKTAMVTICVILGEVFFWGGTILVGKDIVKKYIKVINPLKWIKKE